MKYFIIFNTVTNIIIMLILLKLGLKKYFRISIDRQMFTDKIESITLMRNNEWFDDGEWCGAVGIFTIPIRRQNT